MLKLPKSLGIQKHAKKFLTYLGQGAEMKKLRKNFLNSTAEVLKSHNIKINFRNWYTW